MKRRLSDPDPNPRPPKRRRLNPLPEFVSILDEDDSDIEIDQKEREKTSPSDLIDLIEHLASLGVKKTDDGAGVEVCPICQLQVWVKEYSVHVNQCLDSIEKKERQEQDDETMARRMVERDAFSFAPDVETKCPICQTPLSIGMSMNLHINECLDKQERGDGDGDIDLEGKEGEDVPQLNSDQITSLCKSLCNVRLRASKDEFDKMVENFGQLGFNAAAVRRAVVEKEAQKKMEEEENQKKGEGEGEGEWIECEFSPPSNAHMLWANLDDEL